MAGTIVIMQRRRLAELNIAISCRVVRPGLATTILLTTILLTTSTAALADGVSSPAREHARFGKSTAPAASSTASSRTDTLRITGPDRHIKVRYVHSVWNMSPDCLRGVSVGVAVPQNDAHQTVHSVIFDPPPSTYTGDGWDQKTAQFRLEKLDPNEKFEIRATIEVTLRDLEWWVVERDVGGFEDIPSRVLRRYLGNGKKYRLRSDVLERAAESLRIDRGGIIEQVRRIHDYVTDRLEYERDNRWDPADMVLDRGTGSCSEYSYLMIALCRLNGIPARYAGGSWLGGAAQTTPYVDRVFHRWVEVYLPRIGWYPIDPTENDRRAQDGDYYAYFGRLPWSYLTMVRGGGNQFQNVLLGWDYRSGTRWRRPRELSGGEVLVDRYAVWVDERAEAGDQR